MIRFNSNPTTLLLRSFCTSSLKLRQSPPKLNSSCGFTSLVRAKDGRAGSGFTLIETLLALAIMGMVLTPIFITQGSMLYHVSRLARHVERMIQADLFLQESVIASLKETKDVHTEKDRQSPHAHFVFDAKKVSDDSPLKKYPDLYMQRVTFTWQEDKIKRTDALLTFVYKPEIKKSEKAKPAVKEGEKK